MLTTLLLLSLLGRAQQRVAQQRIDSKMDLGRIVDIRKKVFSEVKVSSLLPLLYEDVSDTTSRNLQTSDHKLAMNDPYPKCVLHLTIKLWRLVAGLGP